MSTPPPPHDPEDADQLSSEPPVDATPPAGGAGADEGATGPQSEPTAEAPGGHPTGASGPGAPPPPGPGGAGPTGADDGTTDPGAGRGDGPTGPSGPGSSRAGPPGPDGGHGWPWSQARIRGRRLDRRVDDRVVAGVAGGLGDAFGVDPAIFRLTFVTLTFFGGGGMVLYALCWLFMPARSSQESIGESMLRRAGGPRSAGGIALIAIAVLIFVHSLSDVGSGLFWGAVMVAVGVLVFRSDGSGGVPGLASSGARSAGHTATTGARTSTTSFTEQTTAAVPPPDPAPPTVDEPPVADTRAADASDDDLWFDEAEALAAPPPTMPPPVIDDGWRPRPLPPQPPPPRPPSILGRVTVAAMLIAIGALALVDNLSSLDVAIASYAGVALVIVGGGLLVGAVVGRARGLIPLGAVALVVLLVSSLAPELPRVPAGGAGDRVYIPQTVAELQPTYELGAGKLRLDLTELELDPGDDVEIDVTVGAGELTVLLPPDVGADLDVDMRLGAIDALGRTSEGPGASTTFTAPGSEGAPTIDLDLVTGIGEIAVRRVHPEEAS